MALYMSPRTSISKALQCGSPCEVGRAGACGNACGELKERTVTGSLCVKARDDGWLWAFAEERGGDRRVAGRLSSGSDRLQAFCLESLGPFNCTGRPPLSVALVVLSGVGAFPFG
jgi:hypothetical protein